MSLTLDTFQLRITFVLTAGFIQITGSPVTDPKFIGDGVGIAMRKEDKQLLVDFNKALITIKENGTYDKIYAQWFK